MTRRSGIHGKGVFATIGIGEEISIDDNLCLDGRYTARVEARVGLRLWHGQMPRHPSGEQALTSYSAGAGAARSG
ncbi:MAG: hypothetical protein EXR28_03840 [Betaproteobacteria bacterium]|nr:hypothetical protein [Betaproteobacteria bacterium]